MLYVTRWRVRVDDQARHDDDDAHGTRDRNTADAEARGERTTTTTRGELRSCSAIIIIIIIVTESFDLFIRFWSACPI